MVIQLRSEETGIVTFPTFREAIDYTKHDPTVWKLSFSLPNGERVRLVRLEIALGCLAWVYQPILNSIDIDREEMEDV